MRSTLRRLLLNRFALAAAAVAVVAGFWNAYVVLNADGIVQGRVVGPDGTPVPGAVVRMMEQNFTTNSDRGETRTGADGRFEFRNNRSHSIQLRGEKEGLGRSDQKVVRLYFRAQNVVLDEPLVLRATRN